MFLAVAIALAALFVRLGVWQLDRLEERKAENALRRARLAEPAVVVSSRGTADGAELAWRRAEVSGGFDYGREIILVGRSHEGHRGAHIVTPLVLSDGTAVLILRGWLPAADGVNVPLAAGRPGRDHTSPTESGGDGARRPGTVTGIILPSVAGPEASVIERRIDGERHLVSTRLDPAALDASLPYSVAPWYLLADGAPPGDMRRVEAPPLDNGPHLNYAVQWFSFAVIAVVGTALFTRRSRRSRIR